MRKLIVEFIPAVVPDGGWPDRPWDHRQVSDDSGSVERVAVDQSGAVIRDAEGDEVQSGPGFDFQVAKVQRQGRPAHDDVVPVPVERLSVELVGVLASARRMGAVFGHAWIGTEHLALALAEHSAEAREILGASWDVAAEAVASFYEGPYAAPGWSWSQALDRRMGAHSASERRVARTKLGTPIAPVRGDCRRQRGRAAGGRGRRRGATARCSRGRAS